jgi:pimeloyl-ACP methyl ester carboxylesterase
MSARFEPITGRYMHLDLFGRPHRIYVEQAGEGTPLLCLHTAGSDGRQYRGLMNDTRVTRNHRVIAFDMPWHGKSSAVCTENLNSDVVTIKSAQDRI